MIKLNFRPLPGLSSGHLQTILGSLRKPPAAPPSKNWQVSIENNDLLSCEISAPDSYNQIVVLVHGLGGSHNSNYMIRMARKLYDQNIMAVRVNLRGCGSGKGLSSLPYHGGRSQDLLAVLELLKQQNPSKEIVTLGFSLGANIVLKLAGELGDDASRLIKKTIAVCPPLDLGHTVRRMQKRRYGFYHSYFLKKVVEQAEPWMKNKVRSIYEFDNTITAHYWGFSGAEEYYKSSSSLFYLSKIQHPCRLLFAEDDPFIAKEIIKAAQGMPVELFTTKYGGHMGFLGQTAKEHTSYWLDQQLFEWIES